MTSPFSFPDWVPWWAQLLVLILAILFGLALLLMPFSVFGVKSRLDAIEDRLEEVQGELRVIALRLAENARRLPAEEPRRAFEEEPRRAPERYGEVPVVPVRPPATWAPDAGPRGPIGGRQEPRIDRFR